MSEASQQYAAHRLFQAVDGIPAVHLAWKDTIRLTRPVQSHTSR